MSTHPELLGKKFPSNSGIVPMTRDAFPTRLTAETHIRDGLREKNRKMAGE
jgi:hypothetical protein